MAEQLDLNPLRGGELTEGQSEPPHVLHAAFHGLPLLFVSSTSTKLLKLENSHYKRMSTFTPSFLQYLLLFK